MSIFLTFQKPDIRYFFSGFAATLKPDNFYGSN
jgi:hypothetical protein